MAPIPFLTPLSDLYSQLISRTTSFPKAQTLTARQTQSNGIVVLPTTYNVPAGSPSPGTVAGIVLGVVGGICFVLWILYTVFNMNASSVNEVEVIKTKPARRSRHSERQARSEIIEVSRTRARSSPRHREEIIVEEVRRAPRERIVEEEDDIVEVIEEHSPVRRQRRSSGYRNVDPNEFGGGRRDRRNVR